LQRKGGGQGGFLLLHTPHIGPVRGSAQPAASLHG
jgi:hypothetical protein